MDWSIELSNLIDQENAAEESRKKDISTVSIQFPMDTEYKGSKTPPNHHPIKHENFPCKIESKLVPQPSKSRRHDLRRLTAHFQPGQIRTLTDIPFIGHRRRRSHLTQIARQRIRKPLSQS